ncbi:hypothetical protein ARMSODRAFT_1019493 [Armillaria solidipes]|uniref:Uncharacterized protein n=1 Tax=Armillaria solidipes TaxID=1076256 RepID=A0A2H3BDH5_9AGAR|nr:hypothetical protein ARMSODRAFT_1019493 [Armillaria solidipes]
MLNSDSDSCAFTLTSTFDSISRSSASVPSVASQEHPIAAEWAKWEDRPYECAPITWESL